MTRPKLKWPDVPWVECLESSTGLDGIARCTRCGKVLKLGLPVAVQVFVATTRAFCKAHQHCKDAPKNDGKA
jgi:hypothetical protein